MGGGEAKARAGAELEPCSAGAKVRATAVATATTIARTEKGARPSTLKPPLCYCRHYNKPPSTTTNDRLLPRRLLSTTAH